MTLHYWGDEPADPGWEPEDDEPVCVNCNDSPEGCDYCDPDYDDDDDWDDDDWVEFEDDYDDDDEYGYDDYADYDDGHYDDDPNPYF